MLVSIKSFGNLTTRVPPYAIWCVSQELRTYSHVNMGLNWLTLTLLKMTFMAWELELASMLYFQFFMFLLTSQCPSRQHLSFQHRAFSTNSFDKSFHLSSSRCIIRFIKMRESRDKSSFLKEPIITNHTIKITPRDDR